MFIRRTLLTVVVLASAVPLLAASGPDDRTVTDPKSVTSAENPSARAIPIDDLFFTRHTFGPSWSPDGRQIVFTSDMSGRLNLWKVTAAGGWPMQLTQSDDQQVSAAWSPDGKWIAYQQDAGGNEIYDVYAVPGDGGEVVNLTNTPDIREMNPLWSPDSKSIALMYKPKTSTVYDVVILDIATHKERKLTNEPTKDHIWAAFAWSRDGSAIFANRGYVGGTDSDVYKIDVATGKAENLTPHQGQVVHNGTSVSPDAKTVLITSNEKGGYQNVGLVDVASKKITWVTDTQWEASSGDFSPDGKRLTYTLNQDGRTEAYLVDRSSGRAQKIDVPAGLNVPGGAPTGFSPQGDRLVLSHESSSSPADLWVYNLQTRRPTQLTFSGIASLRASAMPASTIVHYKSFDGKVISAFMWLPFNLKRDGTNPALVLPHGGPTGQVVDYWNTDVMALASRGYICIAPNVRGSTGYGIAFQKANHQDLGGGDLQDEVYATRFLLDTGYVDAKKIGITGGSYGGYMTLMAVGKTPDIWAAAVEEYGIINWLTMLKHSDPMLQEYEKSLLGDPVKDLQVYENASPLKYIHNVKAPLLVLQGENDPRVPREEAEQVVEMLKKDNKTVDVHYYPAEGHGFAKRENQIDAIQRTVAWFDRYLKK